MTRRRRSVAPKSVPAATVLAPLPGEPPLTDVTPALLGDAPILSCEGLRFGTENVPAVQCHLIAFLAAALPIAVVREFMLSLEADAVGAPRTVPGLLREVAESRVGVFNLRPFETAIASITSFFPPARVAQGRRFVRRPYFDVFEDTVDTAVGVLESASAQGAAGLSTLFLGDARKRVIPLEQSCRAAPRVEEIVNVDRFAWRVMSRDYVEPGVVPFPGVVLEDRHCDRCERSHGWREDRVFQNAPRILLVAAEGRFGEAVWFPLEWQSSGRNARARVMYRLVSYVRSVGTAHYTAVTRNPSGGVAWAEYNDRDVSWDYRPRVQHGFLRDSIRLAFYLAA
jgi:hypothetical protein